MIIDVLCQVGTALDGEQVLFFLMSMFPTYDNEFELDEAIMGHLGLLDGLSDDE